MEHETLFIWNGQDLLNVYVRWVYMLVQCSFIIEIRICLTKQTVRCIVCAYSSVCWTTNTRTHGVWRNWPFGWLLISEWMRRIYAQSKRWHLNIYSCSTMDWTAHIHTHTHATHARIHIPKANFGKNGGLFISLHLLMNEQNLNFNLEIDCWQISFTIQPNGANWRWSLGI